MRDRLLAGALAGLLADAIKLGFNYLAYRLHFAGVVFWQIVATHFVGKDDLHHPLAYAIGAIADLTATALTGIAFLHLLQRIGWDHLWLKGVGFGLTVWVIFFGLLTSQAAMKSLPLTATNVMVTPIAHMLYGLALAFFARILYQPKAAPGRAEGP